MGAQGGVWRYGWAHGGYNREHEQKEKNSPMAGVHRRVVKRGHSVGIPHAGGRREGVEAWWAHMGYNREHKQKKKTHLVAQAGTGRHGETQSGGAGRAQVAVVVALDERRGKQLGSRLVDALSGAGAACHTSTSAFGT